MRRASRIAFERVDPNDPTLTLDGLKELLPARRDNDYNTLALSWLDDLFATPADGREPDASRPALPDNALAVNDLGEYFRPREPLGFFEVTDDVWEEPRS